MCFASPKYLETWLRALSCAERDDCCFDEPACPWLILGRLKHFGRVFLIHFGHRNISVVCLAVVLKLTVTVFLAHTFKHSYRNDLHFFARFKNVSVYDLKMTEKKTASKRVRAVELREKQVLTKCRPLPAQPNAVSQPN